MARSLEALKEWTGKTRAKVVYDSTVDAFTASGLFTKVKGKRNIALIAFTTDGDVFGGFYSVAATVQDRCFDDPNFFIFSFESHGRCATPMKFDVKEDKRGDWAFRFLRLNSTAWFVQLGLDSVGNFGLGNEKSRTYCFYLSKFFQNISDTTLTGKNGVGQLHSCCRLLAVHLS